MISIIKRFRGQRTEVARRNGTYAGTVDSDGNISIVLSTYDGRVPDYIITINGGSLRPLSARAQEALEGITGFDYKTTVKVK